MKILLTTLVSLFTLAGLYAQDAASVYTYTFGGAEISLLQEGARDSNPDVLVGASAEIINRYATNGALPGATNAFVARINGKTVLIDSGFGTKLFENLRSLGIEPEAVDIVLLTHLHGDHIGGMLKEGRIMFPKAEVYVSKPEYDYWANGTNAGAKAFLEAYKGQLRLFDPTGFDSAPFRVAPGVDAFAAFGHTPGHTVYLLEDGEARVLVIGDVINVAAVQFPRPDIAAVYDVDPAEASRTKVKVLEYAAANRIPVAGMHLSFPGIGQVTGNGEGGFDFKPVR